MKRSDQTPEQRAIFAERAKARERAKKARYRAKRRAALAGTVFVAGMSKTHPIYRRRLPPIPDMLFKSEMRAFLTQAVLNTAAQVTP